MGYAVCYTIKIAREILQRPSSATNVAFEWETSEFLKPHPVV